MNKKLRKILIILFAILILFSAWQLLKMLKEYREGQDSYVSLEQYITVGESSPSLFRPAEMVEIDAQETGNTVWPEVDFTKLLEKNTDIIGWIYIEGTNISYPVVKSDDNEYYLNHLFDKSKNSSGCIFLDMACADDFSGPHSIIYGHHMKDKSMFANLVEYKEQEFYNAHPIALLLTPNSRYKIHLFSGYVTDNWSSAWYKDFSEIDYASWLSEIKAKSTFDSEHIPRETDRIVTLSTCTYEFDDAKFVVHGFVEEIPIQ